MACETVGKLASTQRVYRKAHFLGMCEHPPAVRGRRGETWYRRTVSQDRGHGGDQKSCMPATFMGRFGG